jgi:hypothetical protein
MAAGILLYGIALDESDTEWAEFFEAHSCNLRVATKAAGGRKQVAVEHPPFGCMIVGRDRWWFVTVPESCFLAPGPTTAAIARLKPQAEWAERLRQFCALFDLSERQPGWYVTWVSDDEHHGDSLTVR